MKLGLDQIKCLLDLIDHPENRFPSIHIAGTNGKGSTAALFESVLRCAGYRTGLYTSPHLVDVRERILISGRPIAQQDFMQTLRALQPHYERANASFFEILTAMAFLQFADRSVDIAVLETGLGGRLDATNTVIPLISIITAIGLDHTRILGKELEAIAREKAGILKKGIPCICGVTSLKLLRYFRTACADRSVPVRFSREELKFSAVKMTEHGSNFDCETGRRRYERLFVGLPGRHQIQNAGLVLMAVEAMQDAGWKISDEALRQGFETVRWPARLQIIPGKPKILLDSAHNPLGMESLASALKTFIDYERFILVFGVLEDKDYRRMLSHIQPVVDHAIFTRPLNRRALEPDRLPRLRIMQETESEVIPGIGEAWDRALSLAGPDDLVGAAGSMYVVGEILKRLKTGRTPPATTGMKRGH
jgi:dihydrofolate synthase/folylpolyglutamate synthase